MQPFSVFLRSFQVHESSPYPCLSVPMCFCGDHTAAGQSVSVYAASSRLPGAQPRLWYRRGSDCQCWPNKGPAVVQSSMWQHRAQRDVGEFRVQAWLQTYGLDTWLLPWVRCVTLSPPLFPHSWVSPKMIWMGLKQGLGALVYYGGHPRQSKAPAS